MAPRIATVLLAVAATRLLAAPLAAAELVVVVQDGTGEGLNDPSPRTPVGGNPGTTLGAQRRLAIEHAAALWGELISSPVPIRITASFDALFCNGRSATLGSAGPTSVLRDFAGALRANTWYPQALANSLAGSDLLPDLDDIDMQFSSAIDRECLPGLRWYYGFDGAAGIDELDFPTTVLHEIAHGLGFLTLVDPGNGERFANRDDVFMTFLLDSRSGRGWPLLNNAERAASGTAPGTLVWAGANLVAASPLLASGRHADGTVEIYAPKPSESGSSLSHFSTTLTPDELMEPFLTEAPNMDLAVLALLDLGWQSNGSLADVTPTATPSPSPITPPLTSTGTPLTATATPPTSCAGDCDGDGTVGVDELVRAVGVALGEHPLSACTAADGNGDGVLTIEELLGAVRHSVDGCANRPQRLQLK